jgi:hypothetical protein
MRGVDHQAVWLTSLAREACEDTVVQRLGRTVVGRRIAPAQPVMGNEQDAADHPLVVHPRHAM